MAKGGRRSRQTDVETDNFTDRITVRLQTGEKYKKTSADTVCALRKLKQQTE